MLNDCQPCSRKENSTNNPDHFNSKTKNGTIEYPRNMQTVVLETDMELDNTQNYFVLIILQHKPCIGPLPSLDKMN